VVAEPKPELECATVHLLPTVVHRAQDQLVKHKHVTHNPAVLPLLLLLLLLKSPPVLVQLLQVPVPEQQLAQVLEPELEQVPEPELEPEQVPALDQMPELEHLVEQVLEQQLVPEQVPRLVLEQVAEQVPGKRRHVPTRMQHADTGRRQDTVLTACTSSTCREDVAPLAER